jgi:hypothetical protein
MDSTVATFGAVALGALIAGLVWWMRSLDQRKGTPSRPVERRGPRRGRTRYLQPMPGRRYLCR